MRSLLIVDDNVELASLLAVVAEVHGFAPQVAHTGREALSLIEKKAFDAALVDLLLPDIPGQDLLRALNEKAVITFAMSGVFRGEQFSQAAVETWGARAYFEKPFAARDAMIKLVALVNAAPAADLSAAVQSVGASVPPLDAMDTQETSGIFAKPSIPPPPPADAMSADGEPAPEATTDETEVPAGASHAAPEPAHPVATPDPPGLPFSGRDVWAAPPLTETDEGAGESPVRIGTGTVARLLAGLAWHKATGELRIKRGEILKVIGLKDGHIVFAASNLGSERFSRFAIRAGKLPNDRVPQLQEELKKGARTSDALVAMGLVNEAERDELLTQLVREIVWSLLDVEGGDAQFVTRAPARRGLVPLSLDAAPLVMEGYRRAFNLVRLRELVEADKRYIRRLDAADERELGLLSGEAVLLSAADGSKSVDDLVLLSELGEREALCALVGLTHLGVLEPRAPSARRAILV